MPVNSGYLPLRIVAGETIWIAAANTAQDGQDIILPDYTPAAGYTLAYQFAAPTPLSVAAVANGDNTGWTLTVTAAQTLLWRPGGLSFVGMATLSGRVTAVDAGYIAVTASPLAVSEYATALTAIETAIANYATSPQRSFTLGGMSVSYGSLAELLDLRAFYKSEIAAQTGNRMKRIIRTRFA